MSVEGEVMSSIKRKRLIVIVICMIITTCILKFTPAEAQDAFNVKYIIGPFDSSIDISEYIDGGFTAFYKQTDSSDANEDYGIIDKKGREIVNCAFIQPFSEGLAAFAGENSGLKGYMDKEGKVVIKPRFGWAEQFSEGLAAISVCNDNGEKWGYIDKTGKEIIKPQYDYAGRFHDGMATVGISYGARAQYKFGVVNNEGREVVKPQYDEVANYSSGLAVIVSNGKYGCIDKSGKMVIKPQYDYMSDYYGGFALAGCFDKNQHLTCVLLDRYGNKVSNRYYDGRENYPVKRFHGGSYHYFFSEIPSVDGLIPVSRNSVYGFVDIKGREVIELKYDFAYPFSEGVARVENDGRQFLINTKGEEIATLKRYYDRNGDGGIEYFCEGLMRVCKDSKWGFIDKTGKEIFGLDFNYVSDFHQGLAFVVKDGKQGFISNPLDVPDNWAIDQVQSAIKLNLVPAYMQYGYKDNISRRDFASLITALIEVKTGKDIDTVLSEKKLDMKNSSFIDVNEKETEVVAANKLGIVYGVGGGIFNPNGEITRQEAAVMLSRTAEVLGMNISKTSTKYYSDKSKIKDWAKEGVDFVSSSNIMTGIDDRHFDPIGKYTRQQAYITMLRMLNAG